MSFATFSSVNSLTDIPVVDTVVVIVVVDAANYGIIAIAQFSQNITNMVDY